MNKDRETAYAAIDSERDYQDELWGDSVSGGNPGEGERSVDEFALYIIGYANDLLQSAAHFSDSEAKLNIIRKIGGLSVACMEQHGAPLREAGTAWLRKTDTPE